MGIVNKLEYTVQYQDIDQNYRLRLYTLENYLLNVAGLVADQNGFGMRYLAKQNCTWVLINLSLELSYLPTVDEVLTIETWVEQNMHMMSVRNYRLYVGDVMVGQAKSVWTIINMTDRIIQNLFNQPVFEDITTGEQVKIARASRFAQFTDEDRTILSSQQVNQQEGGWQKRKVMYSDIDYNGHCNSCKYLEMMLNACEPADLKRELPTTPKNIAECNSLLRFDIKYAKEIYRDDAIDIYYTADSNAINYEIRNADGEISCQARISRFTN